MQNITTASKNACFFVAMCSRNLEQDDTVEHCIELRQDSRPICTAPYCDEPKTREFKNLEF